MYMWSSKLRDADDAEQVDGEAFGRVNIVDVLDGDGGGAERDDAVGGASALGLDDASCFRPSH